MVKGVLWYCYVARLADDGLCLKELNTFLLSLLNSTVLHSTEMHEHITFINITVQIIWQF